MRFLGRSSILLVSSSHDIRSDQRDSGNGMQTQARSLLIGLHNSTVLPLSLVRFICARRARKRTWYVESLLSSYRLVPECQAHPEDQTRTCVTQS